MGRANSINLIPATIENTPEFVGVYELLRRISYGGLILFIASGLITGGVFAYLSARQTNLLTQKDSLTATINQYSIKEGLLLTAKQRVVVIDKIVAGQKDFSKLFGTVGNIVSSGQLVSLSLDDTNRVVLVAHVNSLTDAITVVDTLLKTAESHMLTRPELIAFSLSKDGGFDESLSFVYKF